MAAGRFNFTIEQGTTVDFEIQYQDASGNPIDLAQHQARMMIRPSVNSSTILMTLSSSYDPNDGTGLNLQGAGGLDANKPLSSGSIGIFISHVSSSALNFTTYNNAAVYDLEIVSGSGAKARVTRLLSGVINISNEITKGSSDTGFQY
tara:strand:+ start:212 stop:655 length:444 start_codon:yes stop_codon:yes gene_type:complete